MKRIPKRFAALLLCVITLSGMLLSCADDTPTGGDDTIPSDTGDIFAETEEQRMTPDVPDLNFNNHEFTILTKGTADEHWRSRDISSDGMTGEIINDEVFKRNSKIGEQYGFKIVERTGNTAADQTTLAQNAVRSGTNEFDMFCLSMNTQTMALVNNGFLIDMWDVPHLDLTRPYYDQNCIESLSLGGKNHMIISDMLIMPNDATRCVMFNKEIAENIDIKGKYGTDLYGLVNDGKWTLDTFWEITQLASEDLDGDQKMGRGDRWGVLTEPYITLAVLNSSGEKIIKKDSDDMPYYALNTERAIDIMQKIIPMICDKNHSMLSWEWAKTVSGNVWVNLLDPVYVEGHAMFYLSHVRMVTIMREMAGDFGIVPMPKFDDVQLEYISPVTTAGSNCISIPATATDEMLERAGVIIEALSCESHYGLQDKYYEIAIKGQRLRDEESRDMLDIMFSTRTFDLGYIYNWGTVYSSIYNLTTGNAVTNIASQLKALENAVNNGIKATMQKVLE